MADQVVVTADRKDMFYTCVDQNEQPIDLTGFEVKMQGRSHDLDSITIDYAGTIHDAVNGIAKFAALGTLVTSANLIDANKSQATFKYRVRLKDGANKIDFGPLEEIVFMQLPTVLT